MLEYGKILARENPYSDLLYPVQSLVSNLIYHLSDRTFRVTINNNFSEWSKFHEMFLKVLFKGFVRYIFPIYKRALVKEGKMFSISLQKLFSFFI